MRTVSNQTSMESAQRPYSHSWLIHLPFTSSTLKTKISLQIGFTVLYFIELFLQSSPIVSTQNLFTGQRNKSGDLDAQRHQDARKRHPGACADTSPLRKLQPNRRVHSSLPPSLVFWCTSDLIWTKGSISEEGPA